MCLEEVRRLHIEYFIKTQVYSWAMKDTCNRNQGNGYLCESEIYLS